MVWIIATVAVLIVIFAVIGGKHSAEKVRQEEARQREARRIAAEEAEKAARPAPAPAPAPAAPKEPVPVERVSINFPEMGDRKPLAYSYPDVEIQPIGYALRTVPIGSKVALHVSDAAVTVHYNDHKIGTLPESKIADMVRDWQRRGDPYGANLVMKDVNKPDAQIAIGFYRDTPSKWKKRHTNAMRVKLGGHAEEGCIAGEDDICEVEYDFEKERYSVRYCGYHLGWLPKKALDYAEHQGAQPEDLTLLIEDVETDDDGRDSFTALAAVEKDE